MKQYAKRASAKSARPVTECTIKLKQYCVECGTRASAGEVCFTCGVPLHIACSYSKIQCKDCQEQDNEELERHVPSCPMCDECECIEELISAMEQ